MGELIAGDTGKDCGTLYYVVAVLHHHLDAGNGRVFLGVESLMVRDGIRDDALTCVYSRDAFTTLGAVLTKAIAVPYYWS